MGLFSYNSKELLPLLKYVESIEDAGAQVSTPTLDAAEPSIRPVSPRQAAEIVDGYLAGKSTKYLATEFGRSRATISVVLKREGVEMRSFRASTPEEVQQMIELYRSGLSLAKVAERIGFSEKTVLTKLKAAGVQLRN